MWAPSQGSEVITVPWGTHEHACAQCTYAYNAHACTHACTYWEQTLAGCLASGLLELQVGRLRSGPLPPDPPQRLSSEPPLRPTAPEGNKAPFSPDAGFLLL